MPQDSILDMVNNIEGFYNDKMRLLDRWVEEGDTWSENFARREADRLVSGFAEMLSEEGDSYTQKDIREAVDELLEEFESYREEAIAAIVKQETHVPTPEELGMDAGDIEHAKKSEALAQKIGIERLKELIPVPPERVRKALEKGDKYLNTIPLRKWDDATSALKIPGLSLSDKVSALKHVAIWHYA